MSSDALTEALESIRLKSTPALLFYGVIGLILVTFALWALYSFGNYFLLNEYRQQIRLLTPYHPLQMFPPRSLFDTTAMSVAFSRSFFLLTVGFFGKVCGYNLVCHNSFHVAILVVSAALTVAILRRLFPSAPLLLFAGAIIFMMFSVPVVDALSWQATILDKLSLLFTAASIYLGVTIGPSRQRMREILGINLISLALIVCAYNSKEATFSLVPSMVSLLAVRFIAAEPRFDFKSVKEAILRSFMTFALPILYSIFHVSIVLYNRMMVDVGEGNRVLGGDLQFNLRFFVRYLFNLSLDRSFSERAWWTFAGTLSVCLAVTCTMTVKAHKSRTLLFLWAVGCFAMSFVIPLKTAAASPFYLLVPLFYLTILLFIGILILWENLPTKISTTVLPLAVAVLLAWHLVGLYQSYNLYSRLIAMSANFVSALQQAAHVVALRSGRLRLTFLYPQDEQRAWMFIGNSNQRWLAPYLLPVGTSLSDMDGFDKTIVDRAYAEPLTAPPSARPGELLVVLGEKLELKYIVPPLPG